MSSANARGLKRGRDAAASVRDAEQSSAPAILIMTMSCLPHSGAQVNVITAASCVADVMDEKQMNETFQQLQSQIASGLDRLESDAKANSKRRVTGRSRKRSTGS
jgi:hypothetical protein